MTKKIIIIVSSILIAVSCVLVTILYVGKNEKIEKKSALYNVEKLDEYELSENDSTKASDFFLQCLKYTFNIADIQNKEILADSIKFQQENFKSLEYAQKFEGLYTTTSLKSLGIAKYNLLSVRKEDPEVCEDKDEENELGCYIITYELSLSYAGDKEKMIGNVEEPCEAIICVEKDGFKLLRFFTKWVRL